MSQSIRIAAALVLILHPLSFILVAAEQQPDPACNDAQLTDVCFADATHGWAVGDHGVIWHTDDGGAHWLLQTSTVDCRLTSVQFLDARNGWASGGCTIPYTHATKGVVLKTADGGEHWEQEPTGLLPALDRIKFIDSRHGWGVARSSTLFPSGLFTTEHGGRDWIPTVSETLPTLAWSAADFSDARSGIAAARDGTLALVRGQGIEAMPGPRLGLRTARQIVLSNGKDGWLIGDGGLVMQTGDAGRNWQPPGPLPDVATQFDFSAVKIRGERIWIAGCPGTRIFASENGGRTWTSYSTGQTLPIRALSFVDDEHGWAVGDLGVILATHDGGRTWNRQQSGGTRVAVLGIFCEAPDVPLELLARLSAGDGYLSHVAIVNRDDLESPSLSAATLPQRVHEAVVSFRTSGADVAWQFPIRSRRLALPAQQIVEAWRDSPDDDGLQKLQAYLVQQIRTWRPDVVVTHDANPRGDDPLAYLLNQAVLAAVEKAAADPTAPPDPATGLESWKVKKIYGMMPPGQAGGTNVTATELAPRSGHSLAELTWQARGLINTTYKPPPSAMGFRLLVNHLPQESGRGDFVVGIGDGRGESRRRASADAQRENVDAMRHAAQKRRNLQALLARTGQDPTSSARWLGGLNDLLSDLDESAAGEFTFELAEHFFSTGQWELASETFAVLPKRYPHHALTPAALVWLVHYYSSGEAAVRVMAKPQYGLVSTPLQKPVMVPAASGVVPASAEADAAPQIETVDDSPSRAKRLAQAAAFAAELEQTAPITYAEPYVRFSLASGSNTMPRLSSSDPWSACLQGERWLSQRHGPSPKSVWPCAHASAKPRLDGQLDDEVWQHAKSVALHSPLQDDADWPAEVMLAADGEFLYVAIHCRQAPGVDYAKGEGTRPRDADLARHDRVDLLIDVDRDYATYYRLTVDHRGWTREECCGDVSWNPTWYVAAATADGAWTIEAAIPLVELTRQSPDAKTVWAVGVQRTVPGVGFQSWTMPASADIIPAGFGYLTFGE